MNFFRSSQLSHGEVEGLAKDILRLVRNPVFVKFVSQPDENGLFCEWGKRKQVLRVLAYQEFSRRQIVQRSFRHAVSNEAGWMTMLELFLRQDEPQGVSIKAASLASGVASSTSLRCIDKLKQAGLVTVESSKGDRRCRMLSLTPDGHAVVTRILLALENLNDPVDRSNRQSREDLR